MIFLSIYILIKTSTLDKNKINLLRTENYSKKTVFQAL